MSRREPMTPVEGLKKPKLPPPLARPRTLAPVPPPPAQDQVEAVEESVELRATGPAKEPVLKSVQDEDRSETLGQAEQPKPGKAKKASSGKPTPARGANPDKVKPVSVSVPVSLAEAWRERATRDRTSQVDVLLDAIVAHRDELGDLMKAASSAKPTVSDGLFDRGASRTGERTVGVSLRIKSGNLDVIDQLAKKHGQDKRSPFVAAVLAAYLA